MAEPRRWTFFLGSLNQFLHAGSTYDDHGHHVIGAATHSGEAQWCWKVFGHSSPDADARASICWMRTDAKDLWLAPHGGRLTTSDHEYIFTQRTERRGACSLATREQTWVRWNDAQRCFYADGGHADRAVLAPIVTCKDGTEIESVFSGQVAVFEHSNHKGRVFVFGADFDNLPLISGLNDQISSVKLGPGTGVTLFHDIRYAGTAQDYTRDGSTTNDVVSSLQIWLVAGADHPLQPGEVVLYPGNSYAGPGRLVHGDERQLPALYRSIQLGPSTLVKLYEQTGFTGRAQTVFASIAAFTDGDHYQMRFGTAPPRGLQLLGDDARAFRGAWFLCDNEWTGDVGALAIGAGDLVVRSGTPTEFVVRGDPTWITLSATPGGRQVAVHARSNGDLAATTGEATRFVRADELHGRFSLAVADGRVVGHHGNGYRLGADVASRVFFSLVKYAPDEDRLGALGPGEVALFEHSNFWGRAYALAAPLRDFRWLPGMQDSLSSALPAPGAGVTVFQHVDFRTSDGWAVDVMSPVADFTSERIANDAASSARPWRVADPRVAPFTVESLLQDDYRFAGDDATPHKAYRAVLALSADNRGKGATIELGATEPVTVQRAGVALELGPDRFVTLAADALGQVAVSVPATELSCPALKVRTPDLAAGSFVVVHPDEQAHQLWAGVTEDDLLRDGHALLPEDQRASAPAVAATIRSTFGTLSGNYAASPGAPAGRPGASRSRRLTARGHTHRAVTPAAARSWQIDLRGAVASYRLVSDDEGPRILRARRATRDLAAWHALWQQVKDGAARLASATVSAVAGAAEAGADWVLTEITAFVDEAGQRVERVYHFILDTAEKVAQLVGMVLDAVGVALHRAIDWVAALFDWDDILRTKNEVRGLFEQTLAQLAEAAAGYADAVEGKLDELAAQVRARIAEARAHLGVQTVAQTAGGDDLEAQVDAAQQGDVQGTWGLSTMVQDASNSLPGMPRPPGHEAFTAALARIWSDMTGVVDDPAVRAAFDRAAEDLRQIFARPDSLGTLVPVLLLDVLEALVTIAIDLARVVAGGLLRLMSYAITAIHELLAAPAPLPLLAALYRRISDQPLSILDAICLVVAIPITVGYKLAHGRAPFPADALAPRGAGGYDAATYDWSYASCLFSWALVDAANDAPGAGPILGLLAICTEGLLNTFAAPGSGDDIAGRMRDAFRPGGHAATLASGFEAIVWITQWVGVGLDVVVFVGTAFLAQDGVPGHTGPSLARNVRPVGNIVDTLYGVTHALMFAALFGFELAEGVPMAGLKFLQNLCAAIPEALKFLQLSGRYGLLMGIDVAANLASLAFFASRIA